MRASLHLPEHSIQRTPAWLHGFRGVLVGKLATIPESLLISPTKPSSLPVRFYITSSLLPNGMLKKRNRAAVARL